MSTQIHGADYVPTYQHAARTKVEWQRLVDAALKEGGFRRVEGAETFIHGPDGLLRHEAYANIPASAEVRT